MDRSTLDDGLALAVIAHIIQVPLLRYPVRDFQRGIRSPGRHCLGARTSWPGARCSPVPAIRVAEAIEVQTMPTSPPLLSPSLSWRSHGRDERLPGSVRSLLQRLRQCTGEALSGTCPGTCQLEAYTPPPISPVPVRRSRDSPSRAAAEKPVVDRRRRRGWNGRGSRRSVAVFKRRCRS